MGRLDGFNLDVTSRRLGAVVALVIGVPSATVAGHPDAGEVLVVTGSTDRLVPARTTALTQDTPGLADKPGELDQFREVFGSFLR